MARPSSDGWSPREDLRPGANGQFSRLQGGYRFWSLGVFLWLPEWPADCCVRLYVTETEGGEWVTTQGKYWPPHKEDEDGA